MLLGKIRRICLLMLMFLFCLHFNGFIKAQECGEDMIGITTSPGNRIIPPLWNCDCSPYIPLEFDPANSEEIDPGSSIEIAVLDGCTPFTWQVSGTGYTWNESGTTTFVSNNLNEQLDCVGGT